MSTKRTLGPWYLRVKAGRVYVTAERTDIASMIRQEASAEMPNNADFIVRACNNHDALLAALHLISDTAAPRGSHAYIMKRIADRAIAACEVQS